MPPAAITKLARVFPLKKARAITAKSAAALKPLDTLNVRTILLLWLLAVMPSIEDVTAALPNASAATAEANEGKHTTILTMRKLSDRVEGEMVPVDDGDLAYARATSPEERKAIGERLLAEHFTRQEEQEKQERKRKEDVARGFFALSIGWNNESAEDNKQFRQDAVNAFGEGWVADWEKQSPVTQGEIAGMRYLTENYTMEGDVGHEAITRYNDATEEDRKKDGTLMALDEYAVWQHIQKKGKEWYAGEVAKRKAEARAREENAERLDALLYDFVSLKKTNLTPEEFKLLKDSGIPFDTLNRARDAFRFTQNSNHQIRGFAAGIIGNDEKARQLVLGAARKKAAEDEAFWEFENPVINTLSAGVVKGVIRTAQSFFPDISPTSISGAEARKLPDTRLGEQGLEPRNFEQMRNLFLDAQLSPEGASSRARAAISGDIENAVQSGREEEYKKEKLNNTILTVSLSVIGVIVGAYPLFLLCKASRRWPKAARCCRAVSTLFLLCKASRRWNYEQWAAALAVVLLVLAVADSATFSRWLDLSDGFYLLLRVIVAVLAAWQAARALMEKRHPLLFLLPALLCLIYQPLVEIPFKRDETWLWLNAASVFVLIIGARRKKDNVENDA